MEVKINKEVREFKEAIFFGLTVRQLLCSLGAVAFSILIFFACRDSLGLELTTWLCILAALPFGALGFIRYNGLYFEQLVVAVLRMLLCPKILLFRSRDLYATALQGAVIAKQKEEKNRAENA